MLVESSSPSLSATGPASVLRPSLILGTAITLVAAILPLLFVFSSPAKPTGSLLSPLPEGEIVESPLPAASAAASVSAVIALPAVDQATAPAKSETAANARRQIISFPAGTSELAINDRAVTGSSSIYLAPVSDTNQTFFVKTKGEGHFTVAIDAPAKADLLLGYYVVSD